MPVAGTAMQFAPAAGCVLSDCPASCISMQCWYLVAVLLGAGEVAGAGHDDEAGPLEAGDAAEAGLARTTPMCQHSDGQKRVVAGHATTESHQQYGGGQQELAEYNMPEDGENICWRSVTGGCWLLGTLSMSPVPLICVGVGAGVGVGADVGARVPPADTSAWMVEEPDE